MQRLNIILFTKQIASDVLFVMDKLICFASYVLSQYLHFKIEIELCANLAIMIIQFVQIIFFFLESSISIYGYCWLFILKQTNCFPRW